MTTTFTGQLDTDVTLAAAQLDITTPVSADGDPACQIADALTSELAEILDTGGDWRHVIAWAYDERTAVEPPEPQAAHVRALVGCLDADAAAGEFKIAIVRRAIRNFRAEHVDPDNGWASPDSTPAALAAALEITETDAQRRLDAVAWQHLNPAFWA